MGSLGISRSSFSPLPAFGPLPLLFHICLSTLLSTRVPLPGSSDQERSTQTPVKNTCPGHFHDAPYTHQFFLKINQASSLFFSVIPSVSETILPTRVREGIYRVLVAPRFTQHKDQVLLSSASATLSVHTVLATPSNSDAEALISCSQGALFGGQSLQGSNQGLRCNKGWGFDS